MRPLGELEAVVMDRMWSASDPLTVREMLPLLDREPPLAYTTVLTVMDNLHKKGYLQRERSGRAYRYWATKDRADHTAEVMNELLTGRGNSGATLLRFLDHMSPLDIAQLRRALDD